MTPEDARDLTLGQRVRFRRTLRRMYRPATPRSRRLWEPSRVGLAEFHRATALDGIVAGVRTLQNGECDDGYYDTPTVFYPTESVTAVLVAWHLRRKPVLVLPEDLERPPVTVPREMVESVPADPVAQALEGLFR